HLNSLNHQLTQTNDQLRASLPVSVTSLADSGRGSLRNAIASAPDGGVITFSKNLPGHTIVLTSGPITINKDLLIEGPGQSELTICTAPTAPTCPPSGTGTSRIFTIGDSVVVTIANLTIAEGHALNDNGGGIYVGYVGDSTTVEAPSNVSLINVTLTNNQADQNGGAIYVDVGILYVQDSLITGNHAAKVGGGIANTSVVSLSHTSITQNTAKSGGGISDKVAGQPDGFIIGFGSTDTVSGNTPNNCMPTNDCSS